MKAKISILTPVHIGTGETKMGFEYNNYDDVLYNYKIRDLLASVPNSILLDDRFLNALIKNDGGSQSEKMNKRIERNVDYKKSSISYQLRYSFENRRYKNISVQVKSLNKPYIPGSSIKGSIMNAIYFDLLNKHIKQLYRLINNYQPKFRGDSPMRNIEKLLELFYPNDNYDKDKNISSFLKNFSSCITCRDLFFENMVLVEANRNPVDFEKSSIPLEDMECIDTNQTIEEEFIIIDKNRLKNLERLYGECDYYNELVEYLKNSQIIKTCRNYFHTIIEEEIELDNETGFYAQNDLDKSIKQLAQDKFSGGFYMRIGANTNYFFKTISYLFKKNYPEFYKKNFYNYFSPKAKPKGSKNSAYPLAEEMSATRVIYSDDDYVYYPGVIKVEFIK